MQKFFRHSSDPPRILRFDPWIPQPPRQLLPSLARLTLGKSSAVKAGIERATFQRRHWSASPDCSKIWPDKGATRLTAQAVAAESLSSGGRKAPSQSAAQGAARAATALAEGGWRKGVRLPVPEAARRCCGCNGGRWSSPRPAGALRGKVLSVSAVFRQEGLVLEHEGFCPILNTASRTEIFIIIKCKTPCNSELSLQPRGRIQHSERAAVSPI